MSGGKFINNHQSLQYMERAPIYQQGLMMRVQPQSDSYLLLIGNITSDQHNVHILQLARVESGGGGEEFKNYEFTITHRLDTIVA